MKCVDSSKFAKMCKNPIDFKPSVKDLVMDQECEGISVSLLRRANRDNWDDVQCSDGWYDADNIEKKGKIRGDGMDCWVFGY